MGASLSYAPWSTRLLTYRGFCTQRMIKDVHTRSVPADKGVLSSVQGGCFDGGGGARKLPRHLGLCDRWTWRGGHFSSHTRHCRLWGASPSWAPCRSAGLWSLGNYPSTYPPHTHTQTSCPKRQCHLALASCQPAGSSLSCGNQGQTEALHPDPPFYPGCSLSTSSSFLPSSFRGKGTIPLAFSNLPLSQCLLPLLGSLDFTHSLDKQTELTVYILCALQPQKLGARGC